MNPSNSTDLDEADPRDIPRVLRNAADKFNASVSDLQAAWGDKHAGRIWARYAKILERAAASCERELAKGF